MSQAPSLSPVSPSDWNRPSPLIRCGWSDWEPAPRNRRSLVCVCVTCASYMCVHPPLRSSDSREAMRGQRGGLGRRCEARLTPACMDVVWHLSACDTHTPGTGRDTLTLYVHVGALVTEPAARCAWINLLFFFLLFFHSSAASYFIHGPPAKFSIFFISFSSHHPTISDLFSLRLGGLPGVVLIS